MEHGLRDDRRWYFDHLEKRCCGQVAQTGNHYFSDGHLMKKKTKYETAPPGKKYIWTTWITKHGRRIYASQYGLRAFRILVDA